MKRLHETEEHILTEIREFASELSGDEVHRLRTKLQHTLNEEYKKKNSVEAGTLFHNDGEIWLQHVITPLALSGNLSLILSLRTVSRLWHRIMSHLQNLATKSTGIKSPAHLCTVFPRLVLFGGCATILTATSLLSNLRTLSLASQSGFLSLEGLTNLTRLSIRSMSGHKIRGLHTLVNLEFLGLKNARNQYKKESLTHLVKLKSIKLQKSSLALDTLLSPSQLESLSSSKQADLSTFVPLPDVTLYYYYYKRGRLPGEEKIVARVEYRAYLKRKSAKVQNVTDAGQ